MVLDGFWEAQKIDCCDFCNFPQEKSKRKRRRLERNTNWKKKVIKSDEAPSWVRPSRVCGPGEEGKGIAGLLDSRTGLQAQLDCWTG